GLEPIKDVPEQPAISLSETGAYIRTLLGDVDQWLLSIIFFSGMGTVLTIIGLWGVPYLVVVYGLDVTTASYFTLLGSVGMLVGAPTVGWVSDRIGRRFLPMVVGLGVFVLTLAAVPVTGKPPLAIVAIAYFLTGISLGFVMLALPIVKEKYPAAVSGVATATVNAAGFFGATALPPLMGLVLDRYRTGDVVGGTVVYTQYGYRIAFAITAVAVAVAFSSAIVLFVRKRRRPGVFRSE
ncbi:MAG: MFS transporter, partial [Halanaeroarchaeum sp.]